MLLPGSPHVPAGMLPGRPADVSEGAARRRVHLDLRLQGARDPHQTQGVRALQRSLSWLRRGAPPAALEGESIRQMNHVAGLTAFAGPELAKEQLNILVLAVT